MAQIYSRREDMHLDPYHNYYAVLTTVIGKIVIELFVDKAPHTVSSFVFLAKNKFYDGITFDQTVPDQVIKTCHQKVTGRDFLLPFQVNSAQDTVIGIRDSRTTNSSGQSIIENNPSSTSTSITGAVAMIKSPDFAIACGEFASEIRSSSIFGKVIQGLDVVGNISRCPESSGYYRKSQCTSLLSVEIVSELPGSARPIHASDLTKEHSSNNQKSNHRFRFIKTLANAFRKPSPPKQPSKRVASINSPNSSPPTPETSQAPEAQSAFTSQTLPPDAWSALHIDTSHIPAPLTDLLSLVIRYDPALQQNPKRLYAYLRDLAPDQPKLLIKALTEACAVGIPQRLEAAGHLADSHTSASLVRELVTRTSLAPNLAESTVSAWSTALKFKVRRLAKEPEYPWVDPPTTP